MAHRFTNENKELQLLTEKYVEKLTNIWVTMFDDDSCRDNLRKLFDHAKDFYEDLIQESVSRRSCLENDIRNLQKEADKLKRMLHVDILFPTYKPGEVPLLVMQCEMDQRLEGLREQLEEKREQVRNMLLEQEMLCDELGETCNHLSEDPLPTVAEIEDFRRYLHTLQEEKILRTDKITTMRQDIKKFLQILDLKLNTEFEDRLLNSKHIKLDKDTFTDLQKMYDFYGVQVKELTETIDNMRKKLETLWDRLNISSNVREKFRHYVDYNQNTFDVIYAELKRCETLKNHNIKQYVQQIREEIRELWDKTLKSEVQRSKFADFYSNCYSDDLLNLHEMELADLTKYYESNRQIFELYAERNTLWDRMMALEAKASEPGRYNNRGGQLLKEEKDRKTIATKLPNIEQQIHELVRQYEAREKEPFLVYGENITVVMASQWEEKRLQKEKLSSARKNATKISTTSKTRTPLTANSMLKRTPMSLQNANSMLSLKKTPSMKNLLTPNGALTTGQKRKMPPLDTVTPLAKRSLMCAFNSPSVFVKPDVNKNYNITKEKQLAVSKTVSHFKSPRLKNKIIASSARQQRRSGGSGKKRPSLTKNSKLKENIPTIVVNNCDSSEYNCTELDTDDTYNSFEKCIQPSSRSSIIHNETKQTRIKHDKEKPFVKKSQTVGNNKSKKHIKSCTTTKMHHSTNALNVRDHGGPHSPLSVITSRKLTTKNLPILI